MKYTGMAFQMAITISLFTFGGVKLDAHYQNEQPIFTASLALFGVFIALFVVIRQLVAER